MRARRAGRPARAACLVSRLPALLASLVLSFATGCLGPRSLAERVEVDRNPFVTAREGAYCIYRGIRDGKPGEAPVEEEWALRIVSVGGGVAELDVSILGPPRVPSSPSPREPGYKLFVPTKEDAWSAVEVLRLFHRPDLSTHGMRAVLDRDVQSVEGSRTDSPLVVDGKTRDSHLLQVTVRDGSLVNGTYKVTCVDHVPVAGIYKAELDETWKTMDAEGEWHEEHRHDRLELLRSSPE